MVSMHVLGDGSSLWRQRLQHIDITRLSYNAVRHHGTRLPRYKEGRLYLLFVPFIYAYMTFEHLSFVSKGQPTLCSA